MRQFVLFFPILTKRDIAGFDAPSTINKMTGGSPMYRRRKQEELGGIRRSRERLNDYQTALSLPPTYMALVLSTRIIPEWKEWPRPSKT